MGKVAGGLCEVMWDEVLLALRKEVRISAFSMISVML